MQDQGRLTSFVSGYILNAPSPSGVHSLRKGAVYFLDTLMYFKDFDKWNAVKKRLQAEEREINIRKGEIRWVSFGVNIGSEMDGKGISFARPALIIHVIGARLALIVPLTTKVKDIPGYVPFAWNNRANALCVHQMKVVSQKRILGRLGKISVNRLEQCKNDITSFYSFK